MNKKEISDDIRVILAHLRQDAISEAQTPAPETDSEYEIKNYPRLLQLARAGLVPDDMVFKMANVLKDPKRFGVSPKIRNQLYDLMIKTLNYIVVSDPAAWARFRAFLVNEENKTILEDFKSLLKKTRKNIISKENGMDKIEKYKNLNEEVKKMLRNAEQTDPLSLQEEICTTAAEICEALEDPNRVTALMRSGLVDSGRVARVRTALKDPEKAMKNAAVRSDLINMLMSLINIVTSNPSAYASVKKGASKSAEPVEEELIGGQKKLDVNKNGKVDGADLAALRAGKKKVEGDEDIEEELIGGQKKLDVNKNGKVDGADLAALRAGKKAEESEEDEEIEEEWKSLKKTKVDLNALRQQGYKIAVQHGEGDTLYKIKGKGKKEG